MNLLLGCEKCGSPILRRDPAYLVCPLCGDREEDQRATDREAWLQDTTDIQCSCVDAQREQIQASRRPGNGLIEHYLDGPPQRWLDARHRKDRADHHEDLQVYLKLREIDQQKRRARERESFLRWIRRSKRRGKRRKAG